MEIGGYIELDEYHNDMLHESAIMLNTARNCLAYLIRTKKIRKIVLPKFLCGSVQSLCARENVIVRYYSIDSAFKPVVTAIEEDEWLYVVNYYGFLDNTYLQALKNKFYRVIVDNVQAFFQKPIDGMYTIYGCRKFFGVADGAFLYTDKEYEEELEYDVSYDRIQPRLGRFELNAHDFFDEYKEREKALQNLDIKKMSKLTYNMLHAIDYDEVKRKRINNYIYLHKKFQKINNLNYSNIPEVPFMYPLLLDKDASEIRKRLAKEKIYIPILWPEVLTYSNENDIEYKFANNILPIPIDQRYGKEHMDVIFNQILNSL